MKTITKNILQACTGIAAFTSLAASRAIALSAREGANAARGDEMPANLIGPHGFFSQLTNTILLGVGAVSVLMLIWGGFRYIVSGGDSKKVTDAKNTVLYAIIGLVIALLSYAIVNFVISTISPAK